MTIGEGESAADWPPQPASSEHMVVNMDKNFTLILEMPYS